MHVNTCVCGGRSGRREEVAVLPEKGHLYLSALSLEPLKASQEREHKWEDEVEGSDHHWQHQSRERGAFLQVTVQERSLNHAQLSSY